jgi:hypothetical protein
MDNLFQLPPPKPKPGQRCSCCGLVVPLSSRLTVGKDHPDTSRQAVDVANTRLNERHHAAVLMLGDLGVYGATDDEVDAATGWGHQCTTPVMNYLRKQRVVAWNHGADGRPVKRRTRKGNPARVNVLARYAIHAAAVDGVDNDESGESAAE